MPAGIGLVDWVANAIGIRMQSTGSKRTVCIRAVNAPQHWAEQPIAVTWQRSVINRLSQQFIQRVTGLCEPRYSHIC